MNYIHQNSQRNCMSQETLNANLHVRSAIENKESFGNCDKYQRREFNDHCHCKHFKITDSLRERCKLAWRLQVQAEKDKKASNNNPDMDEELTKRREALEKEDLERKRKLKADFREGKRVWSSKNFARIFNRNRDRDENKNSTTVGTLKRQKEQSSESDKEKSSKKVKSSQLLPKIPKK